MPGLKPPTTVHTRQVDGELIVLDLAGGQYYALDAVGARLWGGLVQGESLSAIAEQIAADYEVSERQVTADLEALVVDLAARGLLVEDGVR